ncbi:hypothetical protein E0Z10_g6916 [Xylaria hypoxylon]|uniref:Uncharacterized protein n=1 Tax=Xylaria hypoxylon TaxID=37992 RepID=A0A4Z0YWI9_9PEZI|nr:hypothetical protein E0Z10_g6916 [Xylaria hypoxylon]
MSLKIDNKATQEYTILKASEEKPTATKNSALAVHASLRSSTPSPAAIPAPTRKPKSFRDIFCRSLEPESVPMASSPEPTTTESMIAPEAGCTPHAAIPTTATVTTQSIGLGPARRPRVVEKFDPPHLNVDKEEFERDIAEYGLRKLKNSRWAETNIPILLHSNTHKIRQEFERDVAKYNLKTLKDSRWAD